MALQNREDGMDTFGNVGQLRIPAIHAGAANPFQSAGMNNNNNNYNNNSLIDIGDSGGSLVRSNTNNPFQTTTNSGFLSSQATGFGAQNANMFNQFSTGQSTATSGAYSSNTLF
ncbi:hypothetical protein BGZ65_000294 [Modicella reniformis]|uniref:Uncharacterized protein n=1 Tax=Modicella reniformis TaxID=1440133 RepID=A0A9P6IGZ4_9FUNG|nr:hypothetical protein BGZ65_000294 [Modicella reniformis]